MGAGAFRRFEAYVEFIKGDIVEIGSERGEGSTRYLADMAMRNNLTFYSIDFEKEAYERAKKIIGDNAFQMLGEDFLDRYEGSKDKIGFAYLDNFDFEYPHLVGSDLIKNQKALYNKYEIELNNENSKAVHLLQTKKVVKYADDICIILFDDTYINEQGIYDGKGGTAVPYLLKEGWNILDSQLHGPFLTQYVTLINQSV